MALKPNHFTCTLGQAVDINDGHQTITDINEFVDHQAKIVPLLPAVAFPCPAVDSEEYGLTIYSFKDIQRGSCCAAWQLSSSLSGHGQRSQTVALLCPSTSRFLFTWLGLMRTGHAVLLLAPQCQPAAIAHLMKECDSDVLIYDAIYDEQAKAAAVFLDGALQGESPKTLLVELENEDISIRGELKEYEAGHCDVAYLHHTSGTSTGLPKPIPQTHRAAIGVLPQSMNESQQAIFTTTPLYHGGIADLFRAWTSNAMICLFPGKGVPITARNIVSCLETVSSSKDDQLPPVVYFSSVPYVLQMMASDETGLQVLQEMQIVGVGGAALPAEIGDSLAQKGINLVSRFGSAECGFLLSSHRDYDNDQDWQYLRDQCGPDYIRFEAREEGLSELVVQSKWPHRAKTNRADGSYATSDLFAPHASIPNAWKYHSRADSQITLITGKKFDPAPLESSIATSSLLEDVLIFGNGQPYPGALLFRSREATYISDADLIARLASTIEKLNAESQDHARLARNMLIPLAPDENKLEKSSKGTILRNKADTTYAETIKKAYTGLTADVDADTPDQDVSTLLTKHIKTIVGRGEDLHVDTDLFSYGVDSVASIQIRYFVQQLLAKESPKLPMSVVEDCGTIERLADFVVERRNGRDFEQEDDLLVMQKLVDHYGNIQQSSAQSYINGHMSLRSSTSEGQVILLTGATGALGAHLLHTYLHLSNVKHIHLLVRGTDDHAARSRVEKSLTSRGLPGLSHDSKAAPSNPASPNVTIHRSKLSEPKLGLSSEVYETLQSEITNIVHAAWSVNFRVRLSSFVKDHIAGLRHLLDLTLASQRHATFSFVSSVASISNSTPPTKTAMLSETISTQPEHASPLGYSRSKWVAEAIIARAYRECPVLGNRLSIFRVGQLSGDTRHGLWNATEAWPMMLASSKDTKVLPNLGSDEKLNWLPVDVAAQGIVEATVSENAAPDQEGPSVYHVLNDAEPAATWDDLARWVKQLDSSIAVVKPKIWLEKMDELQKTKPNHPALKLLGLWKTAYGGGESNEVQPPTEEVECSSSGVRFDTTKARAAAPALRSIQPVDEEYFSKLWRWIIENV